MGHFAFALTFCWRTRSFITVHFSSTQSVRQAGQSGHAGRRATSLDSLTKEKTGRRQPCVKRQPFRDGLESLPKSQVPRKETARKHASTCKHASYKVINSGIAMRPHTVNSGIEKQIRPPSRRSRWQLASRRNIAKKLTNIW